MLTVGVDSFALCKGCTFLPAAQHSTAQHSTVGTVRELLNVFVGSATISKLLIERVSWFGFCHTYWWRYA